MVKTLTKPELEKLGKLIKTQADEDKTFTMSGYYIYGWTSKGLQNVFELTKDPGHGICANSLMKHYNEIVSNIEGIKDVLIFPDEKEKTWQDFIN